MYVADKKLLFTSEHMVLLLQHNSQIKKQNFNIEVWNSKAKNNNKEKNKDKLKNVINFFNYAYWERSVDVFPVWWVSGEFPSHVFPCRG